MCDPATIALTAAAAGTAVSAFGSLDEGNQKAKANLTTAAFRDAEARRVDELGAVEEESSRRSTRIQLGQQLADFAAAGRDPTSGTALEVAAQSARQGELEALSVRTRTQLEGGKLRTEADLLREEAGDARRGGFITAGARILTGATRIAALA